MEAGSKRKLIERRTTVRLPIQVKFQYNIIGASEGPAEVIKAQTKNISSSGLLFESKEQIPIDTQLDIVLNMPGSPPESFEIEGRVVRVEKLLPSGKFGIGVNFVKISEDHKEEIKRRVERMDILKLLERIRREDISDLHLTINSPPMLRCYGQLKPLGGERLSAEEIKQMVYSILSEEQKRHFETDKDLDFSFSPSLDSRYRVSIYQQRGTTEVVFRNIMPDIKSRTELGLPEVIDELCLLRDGMIIIAGPTGSGKTTTISKMINIINSKRGGVVLSLEKPIEYIHENIGAIVKQREVGTDVSTFAAGLKAALRQDPDIIVVGEMLDVDTIETALQAAETGHLLITSLHATDTVQVLDRIASFFPAEQKNFIYSRLSHCIRAIIVQRLLPHKSGIGRVLATEVCVANIAVRRMINSGDFTQLPMVIQTGAKYKMHLMQNSLDILFEQSLISAEIYDMYSKKRET